MTPLLAALEGRDIAFVICLVLVTQSLWSALGSWRHPRTEDTRRLGLQLRVLQERVDLLFQHAGLPVPTSPSGLSPAVERLARQPDGKIAAIKLLRQEQPGLGLAEAKARIEAFVDRPG